MILLFSEAPPDHGHYLYPYAIWAVPEEKESPADLFELGFLPGTPRLDRFYLCRQLRVNLAHYRPSSENRRILRHGGGIQGRLIPRAGFTCTPAHREAWIAFANARFGPGVMSSARLDGLLNGPVVSHLLQFTDPVSGAEAGTVLLYLEPPRVAFYYYAFYDLNHPCRSLGLYLMTWAVGFFAQAGFQWLHLGTCYSRRALYKTRFSGLEFFNGFRWSSDLAELKFLLDREARHPTEHLLEDPAFLRDFHPGLAGNLARASRFQVTPIEPVGEA